MFACVSDMCLSQSPDPFRVAQVLAAAAFALEQQRRQEALRAVVAFAEDLPSHVPTAVFQALNRALQSAS